MKNEFASAIGSIGKRDKRVIFFTGDIGYNVFEKLSSLLGSRFINAGIAEESMISIAAGMAYKGFLPWVYSIAPFVSIKPLEQIRNDLCYPDFSVKIVGNGGGYGYGIQGNTHHALEDIAVLGSLPNMTIYVPAFTEDVKIIVRRMYLENHPSYLRLGVAPSTTSSLSVYRGTRRIIYWNKATAVILGPLIHNALEAIETIKLNNSIDLWSITKIPIEMPNELYLSIAKTGKLLIAEEHVKEGGIAEKIFYECMIKNIPIPHIIHLYAHGYPSRLYGSQTYHQKENQLDPDGIHNALKKLLHE